MVLVCRMFKNLNPLVVQVFPINQLEDAKILAEIFSRRDGDEYQVFTSADVIKLSPYEVEV